MTPRTLPPGTHFGRYTIEGVLGRGTFGTVYAARIDGLSKLVALKVLHADHTGNDEVVRRFHAEALAIAELRHPHVVDVTDVGTELGIPFLAMELLEGVTLRERIERDETLPLDVTLDLLFPIFSAVSKVHDKGIVHRDIKPDNIVLAETLPGRVHPKLLDFGVAKVSRGGAAMTREGVAVGTPYYMSPEQVEEAREADAASDQWSLAVIVYRCLTSHLPFEGRSVVKILHAILEDAPAPPSLFTPSCPLVVERALLRALSKKSVDRFPSVRAFGAVLLPFASRRTREDWRTEFVDTEASTVDLVRQGADSDLPRSPLRAQTRSGPAFQPAPQPVQLPKRDDDGDAHDTIESGAPAMTAPIAPIQPVAASILSPPKLAAPLLRTVAVPPPPVAPSPSERPSSPATPQGTLSLGAHSLSPLREEIRAQWRVMAALVCAIALVAVGVYELAKPGPIRIVTVRSIPVLRADGGMTFAARSPSSTAPLVSEDVTSNTEDAHMVTSEVTPARYVDGSSGRQERHGARRRNEEHAAGEVVAPAEDGVPDAAAGAATPAVEAPVEEPEVAVPEHLTQLQVSSVFRSAEGDVRRCAPGRNGQIVVQVGFTSEGVATSATVMGGVSLSETEHACVVRVLRGLRFPRSQRGRERVPFPYLVTIDR